MTLIPAVLKAYVENEIDALNLSGRKFRSLYTTVSG